MAKMTAANAQGRLYYRYGEGLAAITQVGHITRLGDEQLACRVVAIRLYELVEMILYGLEMRLTIPKRVVGIEGYNTDIL
jgi:hypothetical protein